MNNSEWTYLTPTTDSSLEGNSLRRMIRDCWAARDLAWRMFQRDMSAKYRQSLLGYFWAVVPPVAMTLGFVLAGEASILNTSDTSTSYPLFALIGTILWQTFCDAINAPLAAIKSAKPLLSRIRFPYDAIILAKFGEVLFALGIRLLLVACSLVVFGVQPSAAMLFAPIAIGILVLFGMALGLLLTSISGLYGDVELSLPYVLAIWFFLTPVMYEHVASDSIIGILSSWNPVTPVFVAARQSLTGIAPDLSYGFLAVTVVAFVLAVLGWNAFRRSLCFLIERISG